jgi:magnesium chelatase family protein
MLAAALNPCPCGFFGDTKRECHCSPVQIQRYVSKISGPLLDRIDIHIEVPAVQSKELRGDVEIESSACVRSRVLRARDIQLERYRGEKNIYANSQMPPKLIRNHCAITADGEKILETAIQRLGLSARAHDRILKVSRTIAGPGRRAIPRPQTPQRSHPIPHARPHLLGVKVSISRVTGRLLRTDSWITPHSAGESFG